MVKNLISEQLPEQFRERHSLMLYLYDLLVDVLLKADKFKLSSVRIAWTNEHIDDKNIFEESEKMRDTEISKELYINHIFFSIVKDLCYFLFESLSCIERGKVTVAFSLARKPFLDNLFYLCWLIMEQDDFLEKFLYFESNFYDISKIKQQNNSKVEELITKVQEEMIKNKYRLFDFSSEILPLYNILYDKKAPYGINSVFNRSHHLVTSDRNYKTSNRDLNYVFFDEKNWDEYWQLYYDKVPYIIFFIVEVVFYLFENLNNIPTEYSLINQSIRETKFFLAFLNGQSKEEFYEILDGLFNDDILSMKCECCGKKFNFNGEHFKHEIRNDYLITCIECGHVERIGQYLIDENLLKREKVITIDNSVQSFWELKDINWE